jgi:predicted  nucleic acid-binding Zn-ribbon protein
MSDTPETQEAVERWQQGKINIFDEMARLETERNSLQDQRDFCMGEIERLRKERDEAREQLHTAVGLLSTHPQFEDKHPEEVLKFVKEAAK